MSARVSCSLADTAVSDRLDRLHRNASRQALLFVPWGLRWLGDRVRNIRPSARDQAEQMKDLYLPVSRDLGVFLYLTARAIGARRIVEFGTSFGVSTLYLAAAVKDNGGGKVIGSELEPVKVRRARKNIETAGLEGLVDVREGDAMETLADHDAEIDMAFLDGWKELYLPVIKMLAPSLKKGAVVIADDIKLFRRALKPYVQYMQDRKNGFLSITLPLADGIEYSIRI